MRPSQASRAAPATMRANRTRNTGPEFAVRSSRLRRGLRYRVDAQSLMDSRRRSDILFPRARIAVFVDGCFYYRCPEHATLPKTKREFWAERVAGNRQCDGDTNCQLTDANRLVLRFLERKSPGNFVD